MCRAVLPCATKIDIYGWWHVPWPMLTSPLGDHRRRPRRRPTAANSGRIFHTSPRNRSSIIATHRCASHSSTRGQEQSERVVQSRLAFTICGTQPHNHPSTLQQKQNHTNRCWPFRLRRRLCYTTTYICVCVLRNRP